MRWFFGILAFGSILAAPSAPADEPATFRRVSQDDPDKKDYRLFEGTWRFETIETEGQKLPAEAVKDASLTLKGEKFSLKSPEGEYAGTFKIDATKTPKTIDVTFTEGPEKGKTSRGIYELDDTIYKVCIAPEGRPRPKLFAAEKGSGHVLEVLKKEKP